MPLPAFEPGSFPEWIEAGIAAYNLATSFRKRRLGDFYDQIRKDPELAGDAIMEVLESEDLFREIYERGAEAAARSSKEAKRRLLGRVVAAALDGSGFAQPNEAVALIRTLDALEPLDLQLLVRLSQPIPGSTEFAGGQMEGYFTINDIVRSWSELDDTLDATLAVLVREGLLRSIQGLDGLPAYAPTRYGRRVLSFLAPEDLGRLNLGAAALAVRLEGATSEPSDIGINNLMTVVVRNLGPGYAVGIRVRATLGGQPVGLGSGRDPGFNLDPLQDHAIQVTNLLVRPFGQMMDIHVTWMDGRPTEQRHHFEIRT